MDAEQRREAVQRGISLADGVLRPEVKEALARGEPLPPPPDKDQERRAAVEELLEIAKANEHDWELYRQTCEQAAVRFLDDCSLVPSPDAVNQLIEAFLPALAIMCQRSTIYDANGGSWKAMGWRGLLIEMHKRWKRIRISAWKHNKFNSNDAVDLINYTGYYLRQKHQGNPFGEMDD